MIDNKITFIIPAAGKSTRFKSKKSKIFFKFKNKTFIEHIVNKCKKFSDKIIIISNNFNKPEINNILKKKKIKNIKIVVQKSPIGMGHAVLLGLKKVKTKSAAVLWSDQIYLTENTINKSIQKFRKNNSLFTFPIFYKKKPYVKVFLDKKKNFFDIVQTRETNKKFRFGYTDCGFFLFNTNFVKKNLIKLIKKKLIISKKTNEIDFLKSFYYFNKIEKIDLIKASSYKDTIGINFLEDIL